ncbi:MAG: phosphatidate cytidylyltransferase [Clostridia bacterium]|jgi:phosphatidate cytidylyltransferase|nr:phosphatidate cytidylyltransferase [Clostridia bacterium]
MLWLRIISAIIGIPLWLGIIYKGGLWLAVATSVLIIIGTYEFKVMLAKKNIKVLLVPVIIGELLFIYGSLNNWSYWFSFGMGISLLIILVLTIIKYPNLKLEDIAINIFMLIYIGWSLTHIVLLRNIFMGNLILIYLFAIIWSTDTGAYFAGRFFGKKKLAPLVSPKKTVEGSIGGLIFSTFVAFLFNTFVHIFSSQFLIISALTISIMGQIGDLVESSFKRFVDVKDSGKIIPGHGGILDRFDSTIISAPVLFYLILFFR